MGMIFVGQTALSIIADLSEDITGATCLVKYKKPSGTLGSFSATITDAENGIISASPESESDIDEPGRWVVWGYVTFADGSVIAGEPEEMMVYPEGYLPRT